MICVPAQCAGAYTYTRKQTFKRRDTISYGNGAEHRTPDTTIYWPVGGTVTMKVTPLMWFLELE